tara:strand:- start:716 stop:1078 length:363 start_codon:yes stop_codon:yes gene_type:complete
MDFSICAHPLAPAVVLAVAFGSVSHYSETKPHVTIIGIVAIVILCMYYNFSEQPVAGDDIQQLREDNENLKHNLMQVYQMVQNDRKNSPPPAPIPPGMTGPPSIERKEDDDDSAKPYEIK